MAFPQGLNFRATLAFVTDGANEEAELGTTANYPRTTAQGNTVGWEQAPGAGTRDRNASVDRRLAGIAGVGPSSQSDYRIDLPSAGNYTINAAFGDASFVNPATKAEFFDGTTSLGVVCDGSTTAGGRFFDATGVLRTSASDWAANNAAASKTFATPIFRCRLNTTSGSHNVNHLYIESAGSGAVTGTGDLSSGASAADGTGASASTGTGATAAQASSVAGSGGSSSTGTGDLTAGDAAVDGSGVSESTGVAAAASGAASVDGAGVSASTGSGALSAGAATVEGADGAVVVTGSGDLVAGSASIAGIGIVTGAIQAAAGGGGGYFGRHSYRKRRLDQKVKNWVERVYEELTEGTPAIKKQAVAIVRPYVEPKAKLALVPKVETIDFAALRNDVAQVQRLVALYERHLAEEEMDRDEEEFLLMVS